eukprot:scaffold3302_cov146-Skeletonema_menzelii.AAC.9
MQQVDEMILHMDDSNSSDDDNKVGSNDNNNDANYTHPAAATKSGRNKKQKLVLLDSGDVLATISKEAVVNKADDDVDFDDDIDFSSIDTQVEQRLETIKVCECLSLDTLCVKER